MFDSLINAVETSSTSDRLGGALQRLASPLQAAPGSRRLLSGTRLRHPVHPFLVTAPIGAWTSASVLDLTGRDARTARALVGAGVLMALPTALTGASDWLDTEGTERRVGSAHATLNILATAAYAASWWLRPRRPRSGVALGLTGAVLASAAGWLGGHLAYGLGVGVDTNAFDTGPDEWVDLGAEPPVGEAVLAEVAGYRLAATRLKDGVAVLADRCSHRGGPLSEGELTDDCFTCPWHGSSFEARTGKVRCGPASVPQPTYETRDVGGRTQVRRHERRALRVNAV